MASTAAQQAPEGALRKTATVALVASVLEWYDFFIYGTASALVFNEIFFPNADPLVGTLSAFAALGVGFIFRPVGGIVFGHFGDRIGRKKMLVTAILMMGLATTFIGLLPTYAAIGTLAPVLLVVLRCVQGLAVGGQWGGAALLVTESAPRGRRGYYGAFVQVGVPAALIVSNVLFLVLTAGLAPEQFAAWGWRVPFLLSFLLVFVGLWLQLRFEDTPAFRELKEYREQSRTDQERREIQEALTSPIMEVIRAYPRQILQAALLLTANTAYFYVAAVFVVGYVEQGLGFSGAAAVALGLVGNVTGVVTIFASAALSDRIGRKKVLLGGTILMVLSIFPVFFLLETGVYALMLLSSAISGIGLSVPYGPMAASFAEMFSTKVRYSGASLAYQLGAVLGGGFAPFVAGVLLAATGSVYTIAAYLFVLGLLSIAAAATLRDRNLSYVSEERPHEASPATMPRS